MTELNLSLSDEEIFEAQKSAPEHPTSEVADALVDRAIADAATLKAILTIRDLFYPILVHDKQHVLVAILDRLLARVTAEKPTGD